MPYIRETFKVVKAKKMIVAPTPQGIAEACRLLKDGHVVGMPTETVYGLAGDAFQDKAVARIFEVKNRPTFNPLIIHVASVEEAASLVEMSMEAQALMEVFWPGPLDPCLEPDKGLSRFPIGEWRVGYPGDSMPCPSRCRAVNSGIWPSFGCAQCEPLHAH